jgi:hypothetical protein
MTPRTIEEIWKATQYKSLGMNLEQFKHAIQEYYLSLVPEKKYHVATITKATYESQNDEGFNSCRDLMVRKIRGEE